MPQKALHSRTMAAAAARQRLCMNTGMNTVTGAVTKRCAAANQSLPEMQTGIRQPAWVQQ